MNSPAETLARLPSRLYRRRRRLALVLRETAGRVARWAALAFGILVLLAGVVLTPLPGHLGLPLLVIGLMIVLRNSFRARKQFVRFQHAHPKLLFPLRRLLRREPEVMPVAWQQVLRMERLVIPRSWRRAKRWRRSLKRDAAKRQARKQGL